MIAILIRRRAPRARIPWPITGLLFSVFATFSACGGTEDAGRPGFPRTPRTPIAGAPFPYATPEEVGLPEERIWWFKERLYARVVARHVVGAEVLVLKNRKIVLHQAMGWADRERRIPLERNSIFRIASMTKPVIGTAILMLAEEGTLNLDDRVSRHLPSFDNPRSRAITVRQLLNHRSGFVSGGEPDDYWEQPSLLDAMGTVGEVGPDFPPGDRFIYSSVNSAVLGALVAERTGQPVERFLETRIIEPLELTDTFTSFTPDSSWASRVASSYHRWVSGPWERYWTATRGEDRPWFSPGGDLFSTVLDYARFLAVWMDGGRFEEGELLGESTVREALRDPLEGGPTEGSPEASAARDRYYATHWEIYAPPAEPGGLPVFGHRGATGTLGMAFPEQDVIVLYFTQSQEAETVDEVLDLALEMFLPGD
jgi:CubicO group peptidase (beta-lactamase class C family)